MVVRWLSAILTIVCVVLGSRPAAEAMPRPTGEDGEVFETTRASQLVRSSKRSGVRARETRRGATGALPPAVLPSAITLPGRDQSPVEERVWIAIEHDPRALHTVSARAPPAG